MVKFGRLTFDKQMEIVDALLDGICVCESLDLHFWSVVSNDDVRLYSDLYYKIRDSARIDWAFVPLEYNFMATDKSGNSYLYSHLPIVDRKRTVWISSVAAGKQYPAILFSSHGPSKCPEKYWETSFVRRPQSITKN